MKYLFIGGIFPEKQMKEIINNSKGLIQFSSNNFQKKILNGLRKYINDELIILSAPFVNSFPKGYKKIYQKQFKKEENLYFVGFNNLWGVRNVFRYYNLKKRVNEIYKNKKNKLEIIFVYSAHTPFLKLALYLKKCNPNIKIILILPDLPEYMNLTNKNKTLYSLFKKIDIKIFYSLVKKVDGFIFLTKYMEEVIDYKKPNLIIEGISTINADFNKKIRNIEKNNCINITYTGTLHEKFGIKKLIEAFELLPSDKFKLNICGDGDSVEYVYEKSNKNKNINYLGQINSKESIKLQENSDILINPRQNNEKFTRYSFPSKNMEYLSTGNPLIAYKLDGIPDEYNDIIFYPSDNSSKALANKIIEVSEMTNYQLEIYKKKVLAILKAKNEFNTGAKILNFIKERL